MTAWRSTNPAMSSSPKNFSQVDDSSAIGPQFVGLPVAPLEVGAVAHGVLRARRRSASSIRHPAQCA
jgi:hypothetical protein